MKIIENGLQGGRTVDSKKGLISDLGLKKADLHRFLELIYISRFTDDAEIQMRKQNKAYFQISGAGHEGVLVAFGSVMRPSYDYFLPYYRDRALCLTLGVTPYQMLCQANGNLDDIASLGRQMPSHWGHHDLHIVSKSSCTGTQFNQGVGVADATRFFEWAKGEKFKLKGMHGQRLAFKKDEVVYISAGDGTMAQGEFWESLNTALVRKLPVLYMVEDNGYAISVKTRDQIVGASISKALANVPDLKIFKCNGSCPIDSYRAALESFQYVRTKRMPALVHAMVTRPYSHSLSDDHKNYRDTEDLKAETQTDVINSYPKELMGLGLLSEAEKEKIKSRALKTVQEAKARAIQTPVPADNTATDHLYSTGVAIDDPQKFVPDSEELRKGDVSMAQAINHTLKAEFKKNPLQVAFGEDVADFSDFEKFKDTDLKGKGGVFKITSGLQRAVGGERVYNSPLAEANIVGRAIGQALRGLRPVVEIQFFDYIWPAFMQLKNELATMRYRSGGHFKCPVVVRTAIGGYLRGGGIYHSQCGESLFTHIPGLRVAFPSNAFDAAGLLRTAMRADDPVLFLEHKHLYYQGYNRCGELSDDHAIPFGQARVVSEGTQATVVSWGATVNRSSVAIDKIEKELGVSVELIDLRTLAPFDMDAIKKSLEKTHRLLVVHEENKTSGFAGEIAARVMEECFEALDAPIKRVCALDCHVPYSPTLEDVVLPQVSDVDQALRELLSY